MPRKPRERASAPGYVARLLRALDATADGPATVIGPERTHAHPRSASERPGEIPPRPASEGSCNRQSDRQVRKARTGRDGAAPGNRSEAPGRIREDGQDPPLPAGGASSNRCAGNPCTASISTPSDRQLRDRGISLRTRTDGNAIVQTVKMARRRVRSGLASGMGDTRSRSHPRPVPGHRSRPARRSSASSRRPTCSAVFDVDVKRETRRLDIGASEDRGLIGRRRRDRRTRPRTHSRDRAGAGLRRSRGPVRRGAAAQRCRRRPPARTHQVRRRLCT